MKNHHFLCKLLCSEGIDIPAKELASKLSAIRNKQFRKDKIEHPESTILEVCQNIHREDLSMLEKANAAYTIFEEHGIDTPAKKLASKLHKLSFGKKKKGVPETLEEKVCKKIGRNWIFYN